MPGGRRLFKKLLTVTDIRKRLAIPTQVLTFLPVDFHENRTLELNVAFEATVWPMVCSTRQNGHKKPVLSKGWLPFVRKNQLNVGDTLTLYMEEDGAGFQCRIGVEKVTRPLPPVHGTNTTKKLQQQVTKAVMPLDDQNRPNEDVVFLNLDLSLGLPDSTGGLKVTN
ncbi:hypothetical protein SLE2022_039850 [Rubroshorea leprosula]